MKDKLSPIEKHLSQIIGEIIGGAFGFQSGKNMASQQRKNARLEYECSVRTRNKHGNL